MIQNASNTNFQSGRNIRLKPTGLDIKGMRREEVQATLTSFMKDKDSFAPVGQGKIAVTPEGVKIHFSPDGDSAVFSKEHPYTVLQNLQTKEYLAINPEKKELYATPNVESTYAAHIDRYAEDEPLIDRLMEFLGVKK